jgi:hypothetical protein
MLISHTAVTIATAIEYTTRLHQHRWLGWTTTRRRGQGGLRRSHNHNLSQGGVRWSKVGALGPLGMALGPLGTAPRARYL